MLKKSLFKLAFVIIIIFVVFIGYSAYSIWSFSSEDQLVKTDVAVVLGAAVWEDEPSPVFRERINHAIWLYENDYVDKIIFTGGKGKGTQFAESEVGRNYAIENNVNIEDIFIETKSKITEENIRYAYEIIQDQNFRTCTIVSDPLHMKRAMLMAENTGIDAYSSPTRSSAYKTLTSQIPFFFRELFYYTGYIISLPFR
ncbi:YdcF family protein [Anaerovorax sp. IOR16]|uniref:YdcF family protein n=1 Tax=Anaerovorax sp. IOR16 TaxID=2773458 RepID=UPI0019D05B2A